MQCIWRNPLKNLISISLVYHGPLNDLVELLKPFAEDANPNKIDYFVQSLEGYTEEELKAVREFKGINDVLLNTEESVSIAEMPSVLDLFNYDVFTDSFYEVKGSSGNKKCLVPQPRIDCAPPHPHKVSSAFSRSLSGETSAEYYSRLAKEVSEYFKNSVEGDYKKHLPNVRSYMTIHSMGGAMKNEPEGGSAFVFRNTEFLLQFQSWWNYPSGKTGESCRANKEWQQVYIDWVTNLRGVLQTEELVDGAFINFVDKDIPLKEYYG